MKSWPDANRRSMQPYNNITTLAQVTSVYDYGFKNGMLWLSHDRMILVYTPVLCEVAITAC